MIQDRENVVNLHFGIPHRNDAGRDDVQALYYNFAYHQDFGGAIFQQGGLPYLNGVLGGWGGPNGYAESDSSGPGPTPAKTVPIAISAPTTP